MQKTNLIPIGDGVIRSTILTVVLMLIYAVIMSFVDVTEKANSIFYLVTSMLSIIYGTIYAVHKINKKGWLIGIVVSSIYMLIIYIVAVIAGNSIVFGTTKIIKILLALAVGALSGMIGVNM